MLCPSCGRPLHPDSRGCVCGWVAPMPPARPSVWPVVALVTACVLALVALGAGAYVLWNRTSEPQPPPVAASPSPPTPTPSPTPSPTETVPADFSTAFAAMSSGVLRIDVVGCGQSGVGTGFLIGPDLVATVDHVTTDAVVIKVSSQSGQTTGVVIGRDPASDLALVRTVRPVPGTQLEFADEGPPVGTRVAAIGYPIGDPITLTTGNVSGLDRTITVEGTKRNGLVETDTAINPGNSGGPLINLKGEVVGLVDAKNLAAEGIGYAIPADHARARFDQWRASPQPEPALQDCPNPLGPAAATNPDLPNPTGLDATTASGIVSTLNTYFDGINSGDYQRAWNVLSPNMQAAIPFATFREGVLTTFDSDIEIVSAGTKPEGGVIVGLTFTSIQDAAHGPDGDTCDVWTLDYHFVQDAGQTWLIDKALGRDGSTHHPC